ncbi:MAG: hypothetical protein FWE40_08000 [Oscillospiraceae bacterium]|nr:hypothetical protein [Oscillospiraceae bacterium]
MNQTKSIFTALRGYQIASRTAKVLRVLHVVALCAAAASLAIGGVRVVQGVKNAQE